MEKQDLRKHSIPAKEAVRVKVLWALDEGMRMAIRHSDIRCFRCSHIQVEKKTKHKKGELV